MLAENTITQVSHTPEFIQKIQKDLQTKRHISTELQVRLPFIMSASFSSHVHQASFPASLKCKYTDYFIIADCNGAIDCSSDELSHYDFLVKARSDDTGRPSAYNTMHPRHVVGMEFF